MLVLLNSMNRDGISNIYTSFISTPCKDSVYKVSYESVQYFRRSSSHNVVSTERETDGQTDNPIAVYVYHPYFITLV